MVNMIKFNNLKTAILNSILITLIIIGNLYLQVFCIPTFWAIIFFSICCFSLIFYPILNHKIISLILSFLNGFSFMVFLYCIIFLGVFNLAGLILIFFGIGILIYVPHFIVFQLIINYLVKPKDNIHRNLFLSSVCISIGIVFYISNLYAKALINIHEFKNSNYQKLEKNFMTEKILGMHFIYHTEINEYDEWRPPKHEPFLVVNLWLNNKIDPLNVDLKKRIDLYKKFFPENPIHFDCSCAYSYSENYQNDPIFK